MLTWKAHDRPVYDLAFTPDGRLLTSADDATVLWNSTTHAELRRWGGYALRLAVSSDGRYAAGAGSGAAVLWPLDGGPAVDLVRGVYHTEHLVFTPDGREVVGTGDLNTPLRRWGVPGGAAVPGGWAESTTSWEYAVPFCFHPDGSVLATLSPLLGDKGPQLGPAVFLRASATGQQVARLTPDPGRTPPPARLAFSPDGKVLAGVCGVSVVLWDVDAREQIARRKPNGKLVNALAFTPDGQRLLTAGNDESIRVWVAPTWAEATGYAWKVGKLGCVAVSADGTLAAAGGSTGKVVVWDLD